MQDETCPSVAHVLDRADGGLVRVRVPAGRLPAARLRAVARAAALWGGGTIEITNRANLQLRGVHPGAGPALSAALLAAGASTGAGGDLRRNVLASPLGGLDPREVSDPGPLVDAILRRLDGDPRLDDLSPKTGVVVDGGGTWHLGGRRDDVVVHAVGPDRWRVLPGAAGPRAMLAGDDVPGAVLAALLATVGTPGQVPARVLAEVPAPAGATARVHVGPLGIQAATSEAPGWVGAMPPLGRMTATTAAVVAEAAERWGDGEVRLTPWRGLVVTGTGPAGGPPVLEALRLAGLLVAAADPLTAMVACAGSAGCTSGRTDAPADATAIGEARRANGTGPLGVHVSGCAKRCAQRVPAAVTLVGLPSGRYDVLVADRGARGGERLVAADTPRGDALAWAGAHTIGGGS